MVPSNKHFEPGKAFEEEEGGGQLLSLSLFFFSLCLSVPLSLCPSLPPSLPSPPSLPPSLSVCLSVCLSVRPSVRPPVCLSVRLSVGLSVFLFALCETDRRVNRQSKHEFTVSMETSGVNICYHIENSHVSSCVHDLEAHWRTAILHKGVFREFQGLLVLGE